MKWKDKLLVDLAYYLKHIKHSNSLSYLEDKNRGVHLAVFSEPFAKLILDGEKTIESRFSTKRVIPFGIIKDGDIVVMKITSGSIFGIFIAQNVKFLTRLGQAKLADLQEDIGDRTLWMVDPTFLENKKYAKFLTLIEITTLQQIGPFEILKKDRTGWALIREGLKDTLFEQL